MRRAFESDEHEETFRRDGAVIVPLLDEQDVRALLDFYRRESRDAARGFHATMFSGDVGYRARVDEILKAHMAPRLLPLLHAYRAVVGNYVVKEPGRKDSEVPVHQDWTFVDESRMYSLNVWCPLVDTTEENGRLHIFKGSNRLMDVLRGPFFPNPYVTNAPMIAGGYLTELPLRAGEAVIYDHALVHASPPNRAGALRVAVNLALVPAEARIIHAYMGPDEPRGRPEVFEVEDAFFLTNTVGSRPAGVPSLGFVDPVAPLDAEGLARLCKDRFGAPAAP